MVSLRRVGSCRRYQLCGSWCVNLPSSVECLAIEWGKYNITVNAVAPTFIRTPGTEAALANPELRSDVMERIAALHRIGEPMDVAGAVVFLASSAASLITGDTILIDGGWTAPVTAGREAMATPGASGTASRRVE